MTLTGTRLAARLDTTAPARYPSRFAAPRYAAFAAENQCEPTIAGINGVYAKRASPMPTKLAHSPASVNLHRDDSWIFFFLLPVMTALTTTSAPQVSATASRLPFADVRSSVHMKHFSRDMVGFRKKEDSICNVFGITDRTRWGKSLQKLFGIVLVQRCIDDARSYGIETDMVLRVFTCKAARDGG